MNLRAGTRHLRGLLHEFCRVREALWAYHAGAERVEPGASEIRPAETVDYVRRVLRLYRARWRDRGREEPSLVWRPGRPPDHGRTCYLLGFVGASRSGGRPPAKGLLADVIPWG